MTYNQLKNRIQEEQKNNNTQQDIIETLGSEGWSHEDIQKAFTELTSQIDTSSFNDAVSNTTEKAALGINKMKLFKTIGISIVFILIAVFLMVAGLPWYVGAIVILFAIGMVVIQVVKINRIKSLRRNTLDSNNKEEQSTDQTNNEYDYIDEQVVDYVGGIMRTNGGIQGTAIAGVGTKNVTENAMVLTNKRMLFVTVPITGAGNIVGGIDMSVMQYMTAKSEIKDTLEQLLQEKTTNELLSMSGRHFYYDYTNIQEVNFNTFLSQKIILKTKDDKKLKYTIRDKQDFNRLRNFFQDFSKN